jgi:hypothetical protein
MQLTLQDDLPAVRVTLAYRGKTVDVDQVLADTGSAPSIYSARCGRDRRAEMTDAVYTVRGIGGTEAVLRVRLRACRLRRRRSLISK